VTTITAKILLFIYHNFKKGGTMTEIGLWGLLGLIILAAVTEDFVTRANGK